MRIVFLLPREGDTPSGGYKVVYEYANALSRRGHEIHVVHFAAADPRRMATTLRGSLRPLRYFPLALSGNWKPDSWFKLDSAVKVHLVATPASILLPRADAYVASWWSTAEHLASMRALSGRKLYLIQHLETWAGLEEDVMATWKAPLEKIVIARWLEKIAADLGQPSHYIPNGLDFVRFGRDIPAEDREQRRIAMLFHSGVTWKGSMQGIAALSALKARYPDLEAELFGAESRSDSIPSWITYHQLPSQDELRRLYNRAAIFLSPSHAEGWPLPPAEAMLCGAAVVATDIGGHQEYCHDGDTALLVPPRDSDAMVRAISRLIENPQLRIELANRGHANIQQYTWDAAADAFERVLLSKPLSQPRR